VARHLLWQRSRQGVPHDDSPLPPSRPPLAHPSPGPQHTVSSRSRYDLKCALSLCDPGIIGNIRRCSSASTSRRVCARWVLEGPCQRGARSFASDRSCYWASKAPCYVVFGLIGWAGDDEPDCLSSFFLVGLNGTFSASIHAISALVRHRRCRWAFAAAGLRHDIQSLARP